MSKAELTEMVMGMSLEEATRLLNVMIENKEGEGGARVKSFVRFGDTGFDINEYFHKDYTEKADYVIFGRKKVVAKSAFYEDLEKRETKLRAWLMANLKEDSDLIARGLDTS